MFWHRFGLLMVALGGFVLLGDENGTRCEAQETVEFERDIQPILSQHCWKCHGEQRAAGGLRLDQRQLAERGGGSGKNLLSLSAEQNELLRRVRSTVDGERMPIEGPPLSVEQIATLERWIAQGAHWPEKPPAVEKKSYEQLTPSRFDQLFDRWEFAASPPFRPVYFTTIGLLVVILLIERAKSARAAGSIRKRNLATRHVARVSRAWYLVGLMAMVSFWLVQFTRDQARVARSEKVTASSSKANSATQQPRIHDPYRPQHPPRLGGTYYRGNDERGAELFNGGNYRTATFHVHLADEDGNDLAWGDPVPDQPHIRFEIIRAPHASPTLFAASIMEHVGLSPVQPEQLAKASEIPFTLLKATAPGERWSALHRLEPIPAQGRLTGKLYLYKGNGTDVSRRNAEPSYLIGYELLAEEGKISRQSQIWMASVYNVSTLQWPEPGQIPADQWFDFRPIPEIEE